MKRHNYIKLFLTDPYHFLNQKERLFPSHPASAILLPNLHSISHIHSGTAPIILHSTIILQRNTPRTASIILHSPKTKPYLTSSPTAKHPQSLSQIPNPYFFLSTTNKT
ncbi:hypothetical protein M6B38_270915 [Iris pallida]|uniref:Uncharacterized protein n=1 Tax=Iris pallida TaxID=29817 RepID=A0AAX6I8B9_IRIPA|nr:hypothetical protein M6B38_270915 [Iris pallida]